ncbi:MAG: glutathione S-transferase family protein [Porticoccaceae bacterium]|nr:glutathione S-transferase family protein [Porticoccaceae bacterium]
MKLYDYKQAPNPRRVRIFMAEKGIEIETVQVDLTKLEQHSDAFKKINPLGEVPTLQLDDGFCINQTNAICRYLEEIYPDNPLYGRTPQERAQVESQNHLIQINGIVAGGEAFRNSNPNFKNRALSGSHDYAQIPELAERGLLRIDNLFADLDKHFARQQFLVGDYFSVADITAFCTLGLTRWVKKAIPSECIHLQRWFDQVSSRPSSKA